ncbi:MAG: DNA-directed RNA polymerase subunit B [Candidatus Aenigmarchaeota archaeon]|nr:DNA-directed RNA polymerase subunit B [Candidatus Aenigmarchaeota archaeon]
MRKIKKTPVLIKSFADEVGFNKFQINSFNDFVEDGLQKIIDEIGKIEPEVPQIGELTIKLGKISVGEPTINEADGTTRKITPMEARIRDLTYYAPMFVEMTPIINKVEQETMNVLLGNLPIMLKSKYCTLYGKSGEELEREGEDPSDPGSYFIVNGTERNLILIEEIVPNHMIIQKQKIGNFTEMIRINSEKNGYVQRHLIERKKDGSITISFANIRRLPLVVLLKALGMEKDKEIIESIKADEKVLNEFYYNLYETEVKTSGEAVDYIAKSMKIAEKEYRKRRVNQILDMYLLPHLGQGKENRKAKAMYLASGIRKIIQFALDIIPKDDLDHFGNKRVKLSGNLLELLFRSILVGRWGLITRIKYNYQKMAKRGKLPPIQTIVESNVVTNQLISAMATGAWTGGRTGVSQRLDRANYIKTLSHLRMSLSPLTTTQEHFEARELHPTNWGRFCPAETPEGPTIGLRKHLALLAEITIKLDDKQKEKFVKSLKTQETGEIEVLVDGTPIGFVDDTSIVEDIKAKRRKGSISNLVNATYYQDLKEIRINTDSGRVRRPLTIVEEGRQKLTEEHIAKLESGEMNWNNLLEEGLIEYIDTTEEDNLLVALAPEDITTETTHLELTPLSILGISASLLPFAQHNRGDRVNFGAKMIGQAIGVYQNNYLLRTDTKSNIIVNSQVPIVDTSTTPITGMSKHPAGQNIVIALMTHHGYNMQDAIIFNRASIERGLFRSFFYRIYDVEERRYWGGQEDVIGMPEKDVRGYKSEEDYSKLNEEGVPPLETHVSGGDVLIGKISPMRFLSTSELMGGIANMRETSVCLRTNERGVVDRVFATESMNGNKTIKVAVRDLRIPEVGDKFASRHGQKSVIGLIANEENLPFSSSGYIPDIVMNPHSIPSRQTVGQLLEMISGKAASLNGKKVDSTAFESENEKDIRKLLGSLGFRSDGKEVMYNGMTGEKYEVEIFIGLGYYQKLDHMVANKIQARSRGPVTLLTRQPTEGKAKEGGLRIGEMEKDCLIAHGAVLALKDRFDSDKIIVPICRKCGLIASWDRKKEAHICPVCKSTDTVDIEMSYAFKLMLDELKSMMIYPKVNVG